MRIAMLARIQHWDELLSVGVNRRVRHRPVVAVLRAVSWLGNGIFWYALMLGLLLAHADAAALPVLHMAFAGAVCTCCYKMVKRSTVRGAPLRGQPAGAGARRGARPLQLPLGPHAARGGVYPASPAPITRGCGCCSGRLPLVTAVSRVALGLHYPSDVLAGAALGAAIAAASFALA